MIAGIEIENGSCDPNRAFFGWFVNQKLGLNIVYLSAKCDNTSFSHSRDIACKIVK